MSGIRFRHLGLIALLAGAWYLGKPASLPASPQPSPSIIWQNVAGGVADAFPGGDGVSRERLNEERKGEATAHAGVPD